MSLLKFIKNIKYLFRYNLKDFYKMNERFNIIEDNIEYELDHIKFEIGTDVSIMKNIKIYNAQETLSKLVNSNCSISRFGDGEINLIFGNNIPCQSYNESISNRLKEVLSSNEDNLMIGIPELFMSFETSKLCVKRYDRIFYGKFGTKILDLLNKDKEYYTAAFSFPYVNRGCDGNEEYFENYYSNIRKIWDKKDIAIISGDRVFNNIKHNIFDNSSSIEYINSKTNNAFDEYDEILNKAKLISKEKIIILILGPTASILAFDLMKLGYRALDLGHIAKDYNYYKTKTESNDKNIAEFFNPE